MSIACRLALEQPPSGRVAEHVDPRALERAQDAVGHLRLILREVRVHRRDDEIELGEAVVGEIEPAVGQDVALDAGEQRQALESAVQRPHAGRVLERAALVEAVGHRQRLAVVGDGDVLMAEAVRRGGHRLEVVPAVGGGRVHVQVAAQIADGDERGQRAGDRRLDFAAMLAQLGLDPRHAERLVDAFLGLAGDLLVVVERKRPYSFSLKPRWMARSRTTMLCALEPVKYCIAAPRLSRGTSRRSA